MKQKDLITYGLIGLAVYFLFLKKEETPTEDKGTDGPELATNKGPKDDSVSAFRDGSNDSYKDPNEEFLPFSK